MAVSGGTRPIKGNEVVVKAINKLRNRGFNIKLNVYGRRYSKNIELEKMIRTPDSFKGQISKEEFRKDLTKTDIFVMNSRHEPFGLSAIDALSSGCSVLISANCGVKEVLRLRDIDIIYNCNDVDEISRKIEYLIKKPNNLLLYKCIDFENNSWTKAAERFRNLCNDMFDK